MLASGFDLTKVSGNLSGVGSRAKKIASSAGADMMSAFNKKVTGRNQTEILQYPHNVGADNDPGQSHYIMFEIYKQDPSKLASTKALNSMRNKVDALKQETGTKEPVVGADNAGLFSGMGAAARSAGAAAKSNFKSTFEKHSGPNSIQVAKNATTKMDTAIALYMPPSVSVSYGANYNEQDIGVMAESINAGIQAFMNTKGGTMTRLAAGGGKAAGGLASQAINKGKQLAGAVAPGSEAIFAINSGSVITPRMELMFQNIQRRNFSFNFVFIPKSSDEAQIIERIVHMFKYHMSSNYGGRGMGGVDGVREMTIPDFFQISYRFKNGLNDHLNKFKKCVLTSTSVEYGSDRYTSFANGQPQTTKLNLSFTELEIITKDYVKDGY